MLSSIKNTNSKKEDVVGDTTTLGTTKQPKPKKS
jgi:hypothetical protein